MNTLHLDTVSPREWKSKGAGWTLTAGFAVTPFGRCLIAESPRGICHLSFADYKEGKAAWSALRKDWTNAQLTRSDALASRLSARIFQRPPKGTKVNPLRAYVRGTEFQVKVWRALMRIKPGTVVTYGHVAAAIDQPNAARAVGSAVGRNLLGFLIPCHRVIRKTGTLGGYRWGSVRKRAMLAWESQLKN